MMSLKQSEQIKFILTRHEQGAAFIAEIYGRLTGMAAACLGTLRPEATNLITGVAVANMDRAQAGTNGPGPGRYRAPAQGIPSGDGCGEYV